MKLTSFPVALSALVWLTMTYAMPHDGRNVASNSSRDPNSLLGKRYIFRQARDVPAYAKSTNETDMSAGSQGHQENHKQKAGPVTFVSERRGTRQDRAGRFSNMLKRRDGAGDQKSGKARRGADYNGYSGPFKGSTRLSKQGGPPPAPLPTIANTTTTLTPSASTPATSSVTPSSTATVKTAKTPKNMARKKSKQIKARSKSKLSRLE